MTDITPKKKKAIPVRSILSMLMAGSVGLIPFFMSVGSSTSHDAYRDGAGRVFICHGHKEKVSLGDVATDGQCQAYLKKDILAAAKEALVAAPVLIRHDNALRASSEFILFEGEQAYTNSPMAMYFRQRQWEKGCKAFEGYMVTRSVPFRHRNLNCGPERYADGLYRCVIPELEKKRVEEKNMCLGLI